MMGSWLASIIGPLARRALVALGIGTVTYTGAMIALQQALGAAKSAMGGMSGEVLSLVAMAGGFEAASIMAGGMVAALSVAALKRFSLKTTG